MAKQESQDSIRIKERKGTWRRFVKLFTKCRLPWLLLLLYIGLEVVFVNVGVDQTDAMAQLFAGDTSAPVLAKVIGLIVANLVLANLVVFTRAVTSARIDRNMRTALTDKILRLPMRFFKSENPRDTIYRIVQNCVVIMDALEEDPAGEAVDTLHGDLALEDVYFGYEPEVPVLQHASCVFPAGSATALLGESGCGKTTLVSLLMRLYDPQSGRITVDGRPITDYALADYRRQFVMVSQNDMIFSGTIRENLCYGSGPLPDERLTDALRKANAYDFVMAMPGGLDAAVEEYGGNLSGGQRQRLSVARAMLSDAPYVILDEPASAMDALATAELMETLKVLCAGRCLIVIAHSPAVLELANRVVVIKDGAAVYQGGVEQAVQENAFVRAFVGGEVAAQ